MAKPEHVQCKNCIFWEGYGGGMGTCRRFPPKPEGTPQRLIEGIAAIYSHMTGVETADDSIQEFMEPGYVREFCSHSDTYSDDWCGEFRSEWLVSP
jgi:hypothetical protein